MFRSIALRLLVVAAFFAPAPLVQAQEVSPEALVEKVSQDVLAAVNRERATYDQNPDVLKGELKRILDPVIDFDAFSRGVMGQYYDQATAAQQAQFKTAFEATLVDLYTETLVISEITEVSIRETVTPSPTSANVTMNVVIADGSSFVVQYSMRKDDAVGWKARNIILDGVNIGLTYRNQFRSAMDTENQDLARVIEIWPELIDGE